jgi:tetratricopeptide (TPR) repeat protein
VILAAALGALSISAALPGCSDDAAALAAEAEASISRAGPTPDAPALDRARRLYRRARVLAPSAAFSLRAADLACASGDEEECVDLLSEVAEVAGELLSPADRLLLARRAETRRAWREAISHYRALRASAPDAGVRSWAEGRLRRVEIEAEAQSIVAPAAAPPPPEARLALGEARRALGVGDLAKARERLAAARKLSPGYAEAALALAALETREGRAPEAIRAYREVLSTDPGRFEALVGLANLLWDEPDRSAKEEALAATDRAIESRPEATPLLKTSALRWAEWGDAPKALARLDAYRRRASVEERRMTEGLRETLARRVDAILSGEVRVEEPEPAALTTPAVDEWRVAQAYLRRGDPSSLAAALDHLREAERLDPTFAPAPELAGSIHEKRGDFSLAQAAYERALAADPARVATHERLAFLLARQPGREAEAEEAWRRAEQAGSSEAIFQLAESASRKGRRGEALALYGRYLAESPGGFHADEVSRSIQELQPRRGALLAGAIAAALLLVAVGIVAYRRSTGRTFEEWIRRFPARGRDARPIIGRLRHEVVKHGGLLLTDGARKLSGPDPEAARRTAALLRSRLFGDARTRGLVRESAEAFARLQSFAREDGLRLDLSGRDPLFSPIAAGSRALERLDGPLSRTANGDLDRIGRVVTKLEEAAALFRSASGAEMSRVIEAASSTLVRFTDLLDLLASVLVETGFDSPVDLEPLGLFAESEPRPARVRVFPRDWETIWRNLFGNAVEAARVGLDHDLRLGISVEIVRDPITGTPIARFVLADNLAAPLTAEMIRGRAADRGWGVVADLVRRHDGTVEVGPPPTPDYRKGIVLEVPAVEPEVPA